MRYNTVEDIVFENQDGIKFTIKDIRDFTVFENGLIVKNEQGLFIDELISRREYFGNNSEDLVWAIADHNAEKLVENNFNVSKIKNIKIPVIENI